MRTEILNVIGMTCGSCTSAVTKALKAIQGVEDVNVDLQQGQATVRFDEATASIEALAAAVKRAGFDVSELPSGGRGGCCCASRQGPRT